MFRTLTQEQRQLYSRAQQEHQQEAKSFQRLAAETKTETSAQANNRAKAMAILAMRQGHTDTVARLIKDGTIQPQDLAEIKRRARQPVH